VELIPAGGDIFTFADVKDRSRRVGWIFAIEEKGARMK
jgi:hypothetical protein